MPAANLSLEIQRKSRDFVLFFIYSFIKIDLRHFLQAN